ncbi:hypothetical protein [Ilumatobacter sp.]|uniref:hypothetical protein n=1 Tax=Ilumatobacter sp. TaxID=1967498 RepID=UPI003B52D685
MKPLAFSVIRHLSLGGPGCGRYTVHRHFPERTDLLRDAGGFDQVVEAERLTGDVRADLVSQLTAYRDAMDGTELPQLVISAIERAEQDSSVEDLRARLARRSPCGARRVARQRRLRAPRWSAIKVQSLDFSS